MFPSFHVRMSSFAAMCNKLLDSVSCCEHAAELFCKQCHCRRFGPKGIGFGIGAGSLTMDTGEQFGNKEVDMTYVFCLRLLFCPTNCLCILLFPLFPFDSIQTCATNCSTAVLWLLTRTNSTASSATDANSAPRESDSVSEPAV